MTPRIALLGFSVECSRFAPPVRRADFVSRTLLADDALLADARSPAPIMMAETPGFVAAMDATGPWTPLPILLAIAEPGGPVDHGDFTDILNEMRSRLSAALPVDGVYICAHGAAITTAEDDPDGVIFAMVRKLVGPDVPVVATLDLHANVSQAMVDALDVFVGYRTNPHVDLRERGEEAARHMRALLGGMKTRKAFVKLPIQPPTVTMLTAGGPYADMIDYGQRHLSPPVLNVSAMGGFAWGDTAKNGLCVVVTESGDGRAAHELAVAVARVGWGNRARFYPKLTPLQDAVEMAVANGTDPDRRPLIFADVADNPGGGGRGNTTFMLRALRQAGAKGVLLGLFNDPPLAEEAHRLGENAEFIARFNRSESWIYSEPYEAPARVLKLSDGRCRCRRGIFAGQDFRLGTSAALEVGGVTVVVNSLRTQCADPMFFETFGLDIGRARTLVVKSRGHFRAGFDEFFAPEQVVEVDLPGLTSPMLRRFEWQRLPRPMIPIDDDVRWQPPPFAP